MVPEVPRILVTGSQGQLGHELARSLLTLGEVHLAGRSTCDFTQPTLLRKMVDEFCPDIVVNAAAYTNVDRAEIDRDIAYAVNAIAPAVLAQACCDHGALFVHYSTDYVFAGDLDVRLQYTEKDIPNPLSVYGQSKLAGEIALAAAGSHFLVFRTSWVYGAIGRNFAKTILKLAGERHSLQVVNDQYGVPTSAALIADVTARVLAKYLQSDSRDFPFGLYHLVPAGETTWHGYATCLVETALALGCSLVLKPEAIDAIAASQYQSAARRPTNSKLDTGKLRDAFGLHLPHWREALAQQTPLLLQGLSR